MKKFFIFLFVLLLATLSLNASPMHGTYTIGGTSPDFNTFNDAVNALITNGVDGYTVFNFRSGTYNEQVTIPQISGTSSTNTIVFQAESGDADDVTITYTPTSSADNYVVKIDGADYLDFHYLTLKAEGTSTLGTVFQLSDGSSHIQIRFNKLYGTGRTASYSNLVYASLNGTQTISYIEIQSNHMYDANSAVYLYAYNSTNISNVTVNYNYIHNAMYGINATYIPNLQINNSLIDAVNDGIKISHCESSDIEKNQVYAKKSGIYVYYSNYVDVVNNEIVSFAQPFSGNYGLGQGLVFDNSSNGDIYYNSVNVEENASDSNSSAFSLYGGNQNDIYNNIFANFGKGYSLIFSSVTSSSVDMDYNDIFVGRGYVVKVGSTIYYTFSDFQTGFGDNTHSFTAYPGFGDNDANASSPWLDNKGTPITGITEDLNGNTRDATNPDIGCDEFTSNPAYATPMSGTYNVGTGYAYDNLTDALNELLLRGTSGTVTFDLFDGNYTGNYNLYNVPSNADSNYVTIALGGGNLTLSYQATSSDDNYLFRIMGGSTTYDLEYLTLEATGSSYTRVIEVNGFSNLRILGSTLTAPYTTADDRNRDLIYFNNATFTVADIRATFNNGSRAIYVYGDYYNYSSGLDIWYCNFNNNYGGVYVSNSNNPVISGNTFNENYKPIQANSCNLNFEIVANQITKTGKNGYAIDLSNCTGGDTQTTRGLIANNTIKMTDCGSSSALNSAVSKFDVVYNSILIDGDGKAVYSYSDDGTNLYENNIFATTGTGLAFDVGSSSFSSTMDYNDIFSQGANLIKIGGATYRNIEELRSDTGNNLHSFSAYPYFTSDMHTDSPVLDGKGISISSIINTDMDYETRTNPPDVGADSFTPDAGTGPLSGTYTIGTSKSDFSSFNDASYALSYRGISDPVTFLVENGTYTEQVEFKEIYGTSSSNFVTIQSSTGNANDVILQYGSTVSDSNYVVFLNGTDYIKFQYLTIKSTNASNYYNNLFLIQGNADYVQIEYNTLHNDSSANYGEGNSIIYGQYNSYTHRTIYGNTFENGYCGYTQYGYYNGDNRGLNISHNTFDGTNYPISCSTDGIQIFNNNMTDFTTAITIYSSDEQIYICNNKMETSGFSDYYHGYNLFRIESCDGTETAPNLIYNNTLYAHNNYINGLSGYSIYNCQYTYFYYNNAVIDNDYDIYITSTHGSALSLQSSDHIKIKNNILAYKGNGFAFNLQSGGYTNYEIDYNDLYTESLFLAQIGQDKYKTIDEIRDNSDYADHSVKAPPLLGSNLYTYSNFLNGRATPVSEVTTDIQGGTRDATTPDIGCLEFAPLAPYDPISGTKTIGTSKSDYSTISDAIDDVLSRGVTGGNVTFKIENGTYNEHLKFLYIPRDSFTGYVTFQSESGDPADVVIQYDAVDDDDNYVLNIIGSENLTFATVTLTSLDASYNRVALIKGFNKNLTVSGCVLNGVSGGSTNYGSLIKFDLASFDNVWISNNELNNGGYGIYYSNYNYPDYAHTMLISGNDFNNNKTAVYMQSVSELYITSNTIDQTYNYAYALDIDNTYEGLLISKNKINTSGTKCLELSSYHGDSESTHSIENNFFNLSGATSARNMVNFYVVDYLDIFNNTFRLDDNTAYGKAFRLENSNTNINIKNNIFANMSGGYALEVQNDSGLLSMDYNLFYTTGTNFAVWEGSYYSDLSSLQTATGMNANSILSDPLLLYTDKPDLSSSSPAIDAGVTISSISDDIYGTSRTAPYDIGAFEYVGGITPAVPQNVTIEIIDGTTARISWDASSQATQYRVEYADTPNGTFTTAATTTNTTVDIPISSTKKFYRVIAIH